MSGDLGPEVVVRAAAATLRKYRNLDLILVGDQTELEVLAGRLVGDDPRLRIVHASEVVGMSEPPAESLRKKKDSSMRVAINQLKDGHADACVSAGNTGALMATAKFVLKMLPGIDRPAIIAELPAGATLQNSSGSPEDVLGGPRLVFLTGSREPDGVTGGQAAALYDLYPDGEQMFLNAVAYMLQ